MRYLIQPLSLFFSDTAFYTGKFQLILDKMKPWEECQLTVCKTSCSITVGRVELHWNGHLQPYTHYHTHIHNHFTALCPGLPGWACTKRTIHPLTPILFIRHPLSVSSIYYDPQHPPCSSYVLDSPFPQPLSRSSLVFLWVWEYIHTPYISSSNRIVKHTHIHLMV